MGIQVTKLEAAGGGGGGGASHHDQNQPTLGFAPLPVLIALVACVGLVVVCVAIAGNFQPTQESLLDSKQEALLEGSGRAAEGAAALKNCARPCCVVRSSVRRHEKQSVDTLPRCSAAWRSFLRGGGVAMALVQTRLRAAEMTILRMAFLPCSVTVSGRNPNVR